MKFKSNDIFNNRYLLIGPIGQGSFGEVWLTKDNVLGINLAIKIYIALDSQGLSEFKNEFKSVYNLRHPNLLRADYFDSIDNNPYLVMPYCPGSVGNMVGQMKEADIWIFIRDVANGLAYLHENDIIHRDIKPDNILRDERGNYVITDFGLSTKMRSTLRKASAREVNGASEQSGTIGYMAPEMFSSKPQAVKATDIWALGATIYEIATGEMPFCGQGGVMELHGAELPELPFKYSKALGTLITKCLAKDPCKRPTAIEIVNSLKEEQNKKSNDKFILKETYNNDISILQKIIVDERTNHNKEIESLKKVTTDKPSNKVKALAWFSSMAAIILTIIAFSLENSKSYWISEYFSIESENSNLKSELHTIRKSEQRMKTALNGIMKESSILIFNIEVWNNGEHKNGPIYSHNTTFIHHSADFLCNQSINDEKIYIKFIAPYGITTGTIDGKPSPNGYSYTQTVSLSPFISKNYQTNGWGGETKGNWGAGNYRIEYWYKGKCLGSKAFKIK